MNSNPARALRFGPSPTNDLLPPMRLLAGLLPAIGMVMLVGILFYPFGYDQAAFSVAGEMISKFGAIPYRDFLDTKPPLIFYIYSAATLLFGHHEWSVRALDLIYQSAAAYYLYRLATRYSGTTEARMAAGLYLILYAGTGFWMTSQAESFATIPSLVLLDVTLRECESPSEWLRSGAFGGLALAILFLLKFTFVISIFASLLFLLLTATPRGRHLKFAFGLVFNFLILVAAYLFFLWSSGGLPQFIESLRWVAQYSSIDPLFAPVTIAQRYNESFAGRLVTTCSLLVTLLAIYTLGVRVLRRQDADALGDPESRRRYYALLGLSLAAQLFGVLIERKMFPYHYSRGFFAIAPLAAASLPALVGLLRSLWLRSQSPRALHRWASRALVLALIAIVLFYSPIVKFAVQTVPWSIVRLTRKDAHQEVQQRTEEYFAADQMAVANYVRATTPGTIFVWGNDVGIYFFADKLPTTFCLTATPFRTSWTPGVWKSMLLEQLERHPPELFISEFGDAKDFITGSPLDSQGALEAWPELRSFLAVGYRPDTTIGHFHLYRHPQR